ncbi:MAG: hypothetical protein HQ523_06795 [Lentisphaerae bacterium]|nr:hypothetical protein [Lentisphaerota bacterium]
MTKRLKHHVHFTLALALAAVVVDVASAQIGEQEISLVSGWNSVWLEVQPTYTNGHPQAGSPMTPDDVFGAYPAVVTVASPKLLSGLGEFFGDAPTNGAYTSFNQEGWAQWHSPTGLVDELVAMLGNRPYIIEATAGTTFTLQGEARFFRPTWTPDRYNLIGFGLDATTPPTFNQFFPPAGTRHPLAKIYSMNAAGIWSVVSAGAAMQSDKAYWIFSDGPSDYMGPVSVAFDGMALGTLNFGGPLDAQDVISGVTTQQLDLEEVTFSNLGTNAATPRLSLQANLAWPSQLAADLRLYDVAPETNSLAHLLGPEIGANFVFSQAIPTTATAYLTIGAKRSWSTGRSDRVHLHRLNTGARTEFWLPVRALHDDRQFSGELPPAVPGQPATPTTGLWVGEVIADQVSSIVEDGSPSRPAAGSAPLRILFHADSNGVVRLLSQVTIMQTKSADPDLPSEPVLVVDAARIPFFEGIKERRGKRVGLRLESVAYDMPRKLDAVSQAELLAVTNLVGEAAVRDYLASQQGRPPKLAETYHLDWPLDGLIGAGQTLQTAVAAPLRLDPFHRSNPFRHAYHHDQARGPSITRRLEIVFDADPAITGLLRGRYEETIDGLIKDSLVISGRVELRQVSGVAALEGAE